MAEALALDPWWRQCPEASLVLREENGGSLGALGPFDSAMMARLRILRQQLTEPLPQCLTYAEVEDLVEVLAERFLQCFDRASIRDFGFTALPRGGLVVLGLLAYRLGLSSAQMEPPFAPEPPLVVIDDIALTGSRFRQWLGTQHQQRLVFGHLLSHPHLRRAIEAQDPRVLACMAASDLVDRAPKRMGGDYQAWRRQRMQAPGPGCYWVGQTDPIAFPWSEPERGFWNPHTNHFERVWRLVPGRYCLRNRWGQGVSGIPIQRLAAAEGVLRLAPGVLAGDLGEMVLLSQADGGSFALRDSAADFWRALRTSGDVDQALATLAQRYVADPEVLRKDLSGFVGDLVARGLLAEEEERHDGA
ncbi:MAG: PqqD family protein [Chromatiaceae bacterium]|nr:PqqD family protein [Candidatus Thioaporhodococcus sediminis]